MKGLLKKRAITPITTEDNGLDSFPDYTKKEIFRQGDMINALLDRYIKADKINFDYLKIKLDKIKRIYIVGGGADYAGAVFGAYNFEVLLDIISVAVPIGEFISSNPIIDKATLVIMLGENKAIEKRVEDSQGRLVRIVDYSDNKGDIQLFTKTLGEFDTASFSLKLVILALLALYLGEKNKIITELYIKIAVTMLRGLKEKIAKILSMEFVINELADGIDFNKLCLVGTNVDYAISIYGSFVLSYASKENVCSSPLSQITSQQRDNCDIIALASSVELYSLIKSNLECTLKIATDSIQNNDENVLFYNEAIPLLNPIQSAVILQMIAYKKLTKNKSMIAK